MTTRWLDLKSRSLGGGERRLIVHLADLALAVSGDPEEPLGHSIASAFDFARTMAKPAISSFVSVKGPSVTVTLPRIAEPARPWSSAAAHR